MDPQQALLRTLREAAFPTSLRAEDHAWMVQECGGHAPHAVRTLYYLRPRRPNCVVNVAPVWDRMKQALAELGGQLAFSVVPITGVGQVPGTKE
jgi:hypothetical protein